MTINSNESQIAIIGMAGKFPQADTIPEFWENLIAEKDCITRKKSISNNKIPAFGAIDNLYDFDYSFFNIPEKEAKNISPQERHILQTSYQALEDAGIKVNESDSKIGIICGAPENEYYINTVNRHKNNGVQIVNSLNSGFLIANRISHKLNLTGPSLSIDTACSTSLTAIHLACEMLKNGEADVMLVGGTSIFLNQESYVKVEGVMSEDGVTRPFDEKGTGFVPANGVATVVLKRLDKALIDNDNIYSIIIGSAINNDGNDKVGFGAPSVNGQKNVINEALQRANVSMENIDYIETHGTGTPIGDAVEIRALEKLIKKPMDDKKLLVGSLKGNYGHLNTVAGIANLIKGSLILKNKVIPSSINVNKINRELNQSKKITLNQKNYKLSNEEHIVGVSSFGIGGSNAHVILKSFEPNSRSTVIGNKEKKQILIYSADSEFSLNELIEKNKKIIQNNSYNSEKMLFTLSKGRNQLSNRKFLIVDQNKITFESPNTELNTLQREIVFMFPGNTENINSEIKDFMKYNKIFSKYFNKCTKIMTENRKYSLDFVQDKSEEARCVLNVAWNYSYAQTLIDLGIKPDRLVGHSLGEYTMAAVCGIISIEQILPLVYLRAKLIKKLPSGKTLSVAASVEEIENLDLVNVNIAAENAHDRLLLSCTNKYFEALIQQLKNHKIFFKLVSNDFIAHSPEMKSLEKEFKLLLQDLKFSKSKYKIGSSLFGRNVEESKLANVDYWYEHMHSRVKFSNLIKDNLQPNNKYKIFIEIGNSNELSLFGKRMAKQNKLSKFITMYDKDRDSWENFLIGLGKCWSQGLTVNFENLVSRINRHVINLPVYPFQKKSLNILEESERLTHNNYDINTKEDCYSYTWEKTDFFEFSSQNDVLKYVWDDNFTNFHTFVNSAKAQKNPYIFLIFENIKDVFNPSMTNLLAEIRNIVRKNKTMKIIPIFMDDSQNVYLKFLEKEYRYSSEVVMISYFNSVRFVKKLRKVNPIKNYLKTTQFTYNRVLEDKLSNLFSNVLKDKSHKSNFSELKLNNLDFYQLKEIETSFLAKEKSNVFIQNQRLQSIFDNLSLHGAIHYFNQREIPIKIYFSYKKLLSLFEVIDAYESFFKYLLNILIENKIVTARDNLIRFNINPKELYNFENAVDVAKRDVPEFSEYITLFSHCVTNYNAVFSGNISGTSILYPNGQFKMLNEVKTETPIFQSTDTYLSLLPYIIKTLVKSKSSNSTIKILEIGAGTGEVTWNLLDILGNDSCFEYCFSDIGRSFLLEAEKEAQRRGISNITFKLYDVEDKPQKSDMKEEFDIVIGYNVVQATNDISKTINNLNLLLKQNGHLVLLQTLTSYEIVNFIFGFSPGWWNYQNDPLRKEKGMLLNKNEWNALLEKNDFREIEVFNGTDSKESDTGIIIGKKIFIFLKAMKRMIDKVYYII